VTTEWADLESAQAFGARVAGRASIRDLRMLSANAKVERFPGADPSLSYHLEQHATVEFNEGDIQFVVRVSYSLPIVELTEATPEDDELEAPERIVANIDFELAALFDLDMFDDDDPVDTSELEAFAVTTGQFAMYPYAREIVYDLTRRLGLPPLTLGLLKMPTKSQPE